MTWSDWIAHHTTMFGVSVDDQVAMIATWAKVFRNAGYTPEELTAATDHIAQHEDPKFPNEHRALLFRRVKFVREGVGRSRLVEKAEERKSGCDVCAHTGRVEVPSLAWHYGKSGGRWYTLSVYCRCEEGQRLHQEWVRYCERLREMNANHPLYDADQVIQQARDRRLDYYEGFNRNWQAEMVQHERANRDELAARAAESRAASLGRLRADQRGLRLLKEGISQALKLAVTSEADGEDVGII